MPELACPRCGLPLVPLEIARAPDAVVSACASCGGVWVDPVTAERVAEALEPALVATAHVATRGAVAPVDEHPAIDCPMCHFPLDRVDRRGVEVDRCDVHGTWFDRGEVARVGAAARARRPLMADGVLDVASVGPIAAEVAVEAVASTDTVIDLVGVAAEALGALFSGW